MSWIWLEGAPRGIDVFAFARRSFMLERAGPLRISCDGRYALWIDGALVGQGPVRGALSYDEYILEAGAHTIGVLARHYGRPTLYWAPTPERFGGLWIDGVVRSDATWRMLRAPYAPVDPPTFEGAPDVEVIDGRAWPHGWLEAGFDDSSWGMARVVAGPSELPARPIAPLSSRPIELGVVDAPATLDVGTITNAHLALSIDAASGTTVEVRCGEEIAGDEVLLDVRDWSLRYTAAGLGDEAIEAFEPIGFRYVRVSADAPACVRVIAHERVYPRAPGASFSCSDPRLDAIWRAGVRALELCSTDAFIDCPSREQRAWLGDDYVNTLISMSTNPDLSLVEHDLRLHAAGQRADGLLPMVAAGDFTARAHTLPDCSLLWVCTLARIYERTGSSELIEQMRPVAMRILDAFEAMRAPDGLLAGFVHGIEGWVFIDWAQIERGDHIGAVDAMYAMALADAATLPGFDATALRARHAATRDAFARLWDAARGAYVDAAWLDGRIGRRMSQQTNSAAICAGLVPDDRIESVIARITDEARLVRTLTPGDGGTLGERLNRQWERPPNFDDEEDVVMAQPFFSHFLHRALAIGSRYDLVLASIRRWSEMVARNGLVEEFWDALPGFGSRCHSWAGTPTYDLVRHVLGARVTSDGIDVEPHLGDLDWAQARIPTPSGWAHVRAERGRAPVVELAP